VICFVERNKDDSPGMIFHYLMKNKSESTAKLLMFINDCKKLGIKIARIQTDRGTEFFEQEGKGRTFDERALHAFRGACNKHLIDHTVTAVEDKEKYAERWIKESFKAVDVLLWNAKLAPQFFGAMRLTKWSCGVSVKSNTSESWQCLVQITSSLLLW
jgi:hypothetical protein